MLCEKCCEGSYYNTDEEAYVIISGKKTLCETWECSNCNHIIYVPSKEK